MVKVTESLSFFNKLYKGKDIKPLKSFRGLRLKYHSSEEMICDCCSDDGCGSDDCCGFN